MQFRRKDLGVYYTPASIAEYLADWIVHGEAPSVLEPCVGGGTLVCVGADIEDVLND